MCVFRADPRIVETSRDRVNGSDLAEFILAEIRLHAVEDAYAAGVDRCRSLERVDASACRLAANETDTLVFDEMIEGTDGVRSASAACHDDVGKTTFGFLHLLLDLFGDDRLEIPYDRREGVRSHYGT